MTSRRSAPSSLLLAVVCLAACAEPTRRGVECIAPANPGGGWDLTCRSAGRVMASLGLVQGAVRTTNIPGAGGGVAFAHAVAQRSGDASVLIAASPATTLRLAQGQYGHLGESDVRWVAAVGAEYGILAVRADAEWRSLSGLMDAWRRDPRSIVVSGGSTVAGQDHMKVLLLAHQAGIDPRVVRYVPFDGGGEAMTALLGGFVQVFSGEASEVEGQLGAGNLRVLAVLAPQPLDDGLLAGVPTALDQGYDVDWVTWRGFYVPGGLSQDAYRAWVDRLTRLGTSDEWAAARRENRLRPFFLAGEEFEAFVYEQIREFREMSREIGLIR